MSAANWATGAAGSGSAQAGHERAKEGNVDTAQHAIASTVPCSVAYAKGTAEAKALPSLIELERAQPIKTALTLLPLVLAGGVLPGVVGGAIFWAYHRTRVSHLSPFGIDQTSGEPLIMFNSPENSGPWNYLKWAWFEDAVVFGYFPALFAVYAKLNWRQTLGLVAITTGGYALGLAVRTTVDDTMWILLPFGAPGFGLWLFVSGRGLEWQAVYQSLCMLIGAILLTGYQIFGAPTETWRFLLAVVVFPFVRELMYGLSRHTAKQMLQRPSVGGHKVNKAASWGFFLWPCILGAFVLRLRFQTFRNDSTLALAVAMQAVFELVQRLTLEKRDIFLERFVSRAKTLLWWPLKRSARVGPSPGPPNSALLQPPRKVSIVLPSSQFSPSRATIHFNGEIEEVIAFDVESLRASAKAVYSMFILGEIVAELVAIVLVPIIYIMMERYKLSGVELEQFLLMERPFTEPFPLGHLLASTALQLVAELCVDVAASAWEISHGFPLLAVWRGRPALAWSGILMLSAFLASAMVRALLQSDVSAYEACIDQDVCWCKVNATTNLTLLEGEDSFEDSIVKSYCRFVYNATAGVPPF